MQFEVNPIDGNTSHAVTEKDAARSVGFYRKALERNLPVEIFKPHPLRAVRFVLCIGIIAACFVGIVWGSFDWYIDLGLAIVIGLCNGNLGFMAHEIAHGSVVQSRWLQEIFSFLGFMPFLIAPTYWKFSHNRLHHARTQQLIRDPDAFPNMRIFKSSKFMRAMFPYTPGSGHKRSLSYFFFWFTFHSVVAQTYLRFRNSVFDQMNHRRVTIEFLLEVAVLVGILFLVGPSHWLWVLVIPFVIQNYFVMSYISTNHNLSPLSGNVNDPLVNSITVTNHPVLEFLHLNFGYHVEHHIFPEINGAKIKAVHHELKKQFPEVFNVMPKWRALKALYSTPRIYKNSSELIHPETLKVTPTVGSPART